MVTYEISEGLLKLHVEGFDKVLALKSSLSVTLGHVTSVAPDAGTAAGWWHGIKFPGANIPSVVTAGTFYQHGKKIFWDIHHPESAVVVSLNHESYDELVIEVSDAAKFIADVSTAIAK